MPYKIVEQTDKHLLKFIRGTIVDLMSTSRYTKINAYNLGLLSVLAYHKREDIEKYFNSLSESKTELGERKKIENWYPCILHAGKTDDEILGGIEFHSEKHPLFLYDTQAYFFKNAHTYFMGFRGTQEPADFLTDAIAKDVDFKVDGVKKGQAHQGFQMSFESMREHIDNHFRDIGDRKAVIFGHSLGGAVATLAAGYIRTKYTDKVMLYTFGSPRAGDSQFVKYYTEKEPITCYRVVHGSDIISMVPPPYGELDYTSLFFPVGGIVSILDGFIDFDGKPFTHFGKQVYIKRKSKYEVSVEVDKKSPIIFEIPDDQLNGKDKINWEELKRIAKMNINDHFMKAYMPVLSADLKLAIKTYLNLETGLDKYHKEQIKETEEKIEELKKAKQQFELDNSINFSTTSTDNTSTPSSFWNSNDLKNVKINEVNELITFKGIELEYLKKERDNYGNPNFKNELLRDIIGHTKMNEDIIREFIFQAKNMRP